MEIRKIFLALLLHQLSFPIFSKKSVSGFYIDNDINETVLIEYSSQNQEIRIEDELLKIFDIDKIPEISQELPLDEKSSAFKYLLDVYNLLNKNTIKNVIHLTLKIKDFNIKNVALKNYIMKSNLIVSFTAQNDKISGKKEEKLTKLWFNVSQISSQDKIISGELKLYRDIRKASPMYRGPIAIAVFQILDDSGTKIFVDSVRVGEEDGWVTVNVAETLKYWVYNSVENRGFYLQVFSNNHLDYEIKSEKFGIVGFGDYSEKRPFLVGYLDRSKGRKNEIEQSLKHFDGISVHREKSTSCTKKNLYINFEDYKWQKWMILPRGYSAYFCSGDSYCEEHNFQNGCCAPSKLTSLLIFYRLDDETYGLKTIKDMSVEECGCY